VDGCLGPTDPLPVRPRRVLVSGASGAGKTWLAAEIAQRLGLPHTEIDALYHGPGWEPRDEFVADVRALAAREEWAVEWQYTQVRDLLADRADLVVWLDLPRWRVLSQVTRRTLRRRLRRQALWNGNLEPPLRTIFTDPEHIIRWSWASHPRVAPRIAGLRESRPDLPVVRLRSRAEVRTWLAGPLTTSAPPPDG
jgi:adenylate kinase family enzyme